MSFGFYTVSNSEKNFDWEQPYFQLELRAGACSWELAGVNCVLNFPKNASVESHDRIFIKKILLLLIDYVDAYIACFDGLKFRRALEGRVDHSKKIKFKSELKVNTDVLMGSIHYVKYPLCESIATDIHCEKYKEGSLVFASDNPYDYSEETISCAVNYYNEMLDKYLYTSVYTFSGLPTSSEEILYEKKVTGSPETIKYQVDFVFFDGYDPERKVLLLAKLYPVPNDARDITVEQYFNYREIRRDIISTAKRQIKAANEAGVKQPIEWHIGLKKQASLVKQLLDDEGVTKREIIVNYTPIDSIQ